MPLGGVAAAVIDVPGFGEPGGIEQFHLRLFLFGHAGELSLYSLDEWPARRSHSGAADGKI
jgi:hypothetical protein